MDLSLSMWILAVLCAFMIGMAKTGIHALGTLVVPIMAFIFGGMPSSGLVLPMLVMADVFGVVYYHRSAHWKTLIKVLPWAFAGIMAGLFTGKNISALQFKHLIGMLVIASLIVMIWLEIRKTRKGDAVPHKVWFAVPFRYNGRIFHHDRKCCRSDHECVSAVHEPSKEYVHRNNCMVLFYCQCV